MKRLFLPFVLMLGVFFTLPVRAAPPQDAVTAAYLNGHPDSAIQLQLNPAKPAFDALQGARFESADYHAGLCQAAQELVGRLARDQAALVKTGYRRDQVDDWVVDYAVTGELLARYRQDLAGHCGRST
jgi:hypothetical protein